MVHTVGILGSNGCVGNATAHRLLPFASRGEIKLVLFHREARPLKIEASENVDYRVIDLAGPPEKLENAVKGVNIFIAAINAEALPFEPNLVDALSKSPDLVTYIPSTYSTTWRDEDHANEHLGPFLALIHSGWKRAREVGVSVTAIYVGAFEECFFDFGVVGSRVAENVVWGNKPHLQSRFPITTIAHLSSGLARLSTSDPETIKDKSYSFVTFWPTGHDMIEMYTKIHGKRPEVRPFTKEDRALFNADVASGVSKVGYWDHWESADWAYETNGSIYEDHFDGPKLEEIAKKIL